MCIRDSDEEGAHLRRGRLALEDGLERRLDLRRREVHPIHQLLEDRLHGPSRPWRKFLSSAGPSGVRTLSGWNWTPTVGWLRCGSAITSPSSAETAVTVSYTHLRAHETPE